ncbi:hypothetical protein B484DRAFT_470505 [Ochromonadaceae sp. CCMP2298]|nr:hypothetical protein B484DRAFT_470505 [Ochromonadaceae sp. CCMP2298]
MRNFVPAQSNQDLPGVVRQLQEQVVSLTEANNLLMRRVYQMESSTTEIFAIVRSLHGGTRSESQEEERKRKKPCPVPVVNQLSQDSLAAGVTEDPAAPPAIMEAEEPAPALDDAFAKLMFGAGAVHVFTQLPTKLLLVELLKIWYGFGAAAFSAAFTDRVFERLIFDECAEQRAEKRAGKRAEKRDRMQMME